MVRFNANAVILALGASLCSTHLSHGFVVTSLNTKTSLSASSSEQESSVLLESSVLEPLPSQRRKRSNDEFKRTESPTTTTTTTTTNSIMDPELTTITQKDFVNDGPLAWMPSFFQVFGFTEGRTTFYGPGVTVAESDYPSEEEQQERRRLAEEQMTNIGMDERGRRRQAGEIAMKVSIGYAIISSVLLDHGDLSGHLARFAVALPLFFATGYTKSADSGLCNVAQGGLWDVDGTGIREIDDNDLARAFLQKVNQMNFDTARDVFALAALFAILPQSFTSPVASCSAVLGGLYLLNGKIPKEPY